MNSILVLLTLLTIHQACSPLFDNTLQLTAISDEVVRIKLSSLFTNNDYHNVTRFPVINEFQIISPIEQVLQSPLHELQLIGFKYYKSSKSQFQFHYIGLLWLANNRYGISFNSQLSTSIPEVNQEIYQISKPGSTCYDLVRMEDGFVIDCKDADGDYFILRTNQVKYISVFSSKYSRKLDQIDNYIYRYDNEQVELYEYSVTDITLLSTLDETIIRNLIQIPDYTLLITDFKTHTNNYISVLNWNGDLLVLQYTNEWKLINRIKSNIQAYYHDIIIEKNIFVIYYGTSIYYRSINGQENTINYSAYEDIRKIFLTQNFVVVQEKDKITLFSQYLTKMDTLIVKSTDQVLSNYQDGFLLTTTDKLIKYTLNQDYYLQAILPTVEENYRFITIYQNANPNPKCKVYIKYKALNLGDTSIYDTQEPSTLITQAIFDKSQDIIIRDIFQGPNLKYNFQNTDLLTVSVLQTLPVTISGIYQDVVYRKIIYAPTIYNNIYLIQQDEIFRITTYTCETNSRTQLKCQQMNTASTLPLMLKDTPNQLWWLNYDSLFLAIAFGNKLDIYYLNYKGQSFEILQTLNLEGDIEEITTDGQLLFVLVDVTIHIYTVTTQDKVQQISTILGADSIYSTQNKDGHLFILHLQTLSLYIINQTQQTLIWQEQFTFDQINVALFQNQFVILIEQGKNYKGVVYNYQNEAHIYLEKQISFYEYTNIQLATIQTNIVNNLLYIRGVSKWEKESILVYDINTQGLNTLFIALEYPLNIQLSQAGNFLFLLDSNKNANNFYITGQNFGHVTVRQDYKQVNYTTIQSLTLKVNNDDKQYIYDQPLQLVNRGEHIFQTLEKVQLVINNETKCADLGQSWYSGQVQNLTMTNSSKLTFKNSLEKQKEEFNYSPFIANFDDTYLIQVFTNKVVLIKKEDLTQVEFPMAYNITNLLFVYQDLVFVEVTNIDSYYLNIIKCSEGLCMMLTNSQSYDQRLSKVFIDENFFFLMTFGSIIRVYDYKENILNPRKYVLIETITPIRVSPYVEIKHMYDNVYHFYSIDLSGELLVAQMYKLSATQSTNQFIGYDLRQMIKSQNIYTPDSMYPSGLFLIPNKDIELLIVFSYSTSISLKFTVDCSDKSFCNLTPIKQATIYQQYGVWYTFPIYTSAYVNEKILSRVFINQNTFQYELFLYDIESNDNLKLTIASLESPIMQMPPEFYQIMSFVYIYNDQLHLLASAENKDKLNHYFLFRSQQLCSKESKIEDNVAFQLKNNDEQLNVQLNVKLSPYVPPPPPEPVPDNNAGTFPYWVIAPIILAVAALGFIGYKCYQKKNKVDDDRLLMA